MAITNDVAFHAMAEMAISRAFEEVIQRVFKELQTEIQNDIYNAYSPQDYQRTYGLLDAWETLVHGMNAEVTFRPEMLPLNPTAWQHGSVTSGGYTDIRQHIFDILEQGYGAYNYHKGKPIPSRPMWDLFIAKIDAKMDKWIRSALRGQGLMVM